MLWGPGQKRWTPSPQTGIITQGKPAENREIMAANSRIENPYGPATEVSRRNDSAMVTLCRSGSSSHSDNTAGVQVLGRGVNGTRRALSTGKVVYC